MNNNNLNEIGYDYAQIGGVRLHYAFAGNGEKLVLLLHGFPEFWYSWRHQLAELSDRYTVVAPDMRGYNLSDKPPSIKDYKIEKLVDDVTGLIRHFGRRQAVVVGHDWGAGVGWATAHRHPEYVSKLAALQAPPIGAWRKNITFRQALASWYMLFFQIPKLPEWLMSLNNFALLERTLKKTTSQNDVFTEDNIAKYREAWSQPEALTAAINYYRANFFPLFFKNKPENVPLSKIAVPTLFIYGEKDFGILPDTVKGVQQFVDAHYIELRIPDAGHWVQQEAPIEVNDILREFIEE